jgi:hypothetical protein
MFSRKIKFNGRLFFSYGGGYFRNGRTTLHRYKYEKKYGSLPQGLLILSPLFVIQRRTLAFDVGIQAADTVVASGRRPEAIQVFVAVFLKLWIAAALRASQRQ